MLNTKFRCYSHIFVVFMDSRHNLVEDHLETVPSKFGYNSPFANYNGIPEFYSRHNMLISREATLEWTNSAISNTNQTNLKIISLALYGFLAFVCGKTG